MDAIHVGEIGMASATDLDITKVAAQQDRVIVTLDSDFHAMLALSGAQKPSVIRIREEGLKAAEVCKFVTGARDLFTNELLLGCFLTVTSTKARLRMLPINP